MLKKLQEDHEKVLEDHNKLKDRYHQVKGQSLSGPSEAEIEETKKTKD